MPNGDTTVGFIKKKMSEIVDPKLKEFRAPSPFVVQPGMKAPNFTGRAIMPGGGYKIISLDDDVYEEAYVVLVFYPANWTHLCSTEVQAFVDRASEFKDAGGCHVIFCSTDSHFSHNAWQCHHFESAKFPMLADRTQAISKSYGVLKPDEGLAFRATFIIDPQKTVRSVQVNDLQIGRDVAEILRVLAAVQHTDRTGQLCPANWRPTLKFVSDPRLCD